ncbi:MAG: hypothetical protein M0C28_30500 [Candidatus Moduliflexus flocculans]|nr:hypothetical protein [Candidatus Moduliflexus flocculans]
MIGSAGGLLAARRLEGPFGQLRLRDRVPGIPGAHRRPAGTARLEILLPGGAAEAFEYRRDFRETVRGGWVGGSAEGPLQILGTPARISPGDPFSWCRPRCTIRKTRTDTPPAGRPG